MYVCLFTSVWSLTVIKPLHDLEPKEEILPKLSCVLWWPGAHEWDVSECTNDINIHIVVDFPGSRVTRTVSCQRLDDGFYWRPLPPGTRQDIWQYVYHGQIQMWNWSTASTPGNRQTGNAHLILFLLSSLFSGQAGQYQQTYNGVDTNRAACGYLTQKERSQLRIKLSGAWCGMCVKAQELSLRKCVSKVSIH